MSEPGAIDKANRQGVTVEAMIDRYLNEHEKLRPLGRTKRATLTAIGDTWLGELEDREVTSQKLVEYALDRMESGGIQPDFIDQTRQAALITDMKNPGQKIGNDV